MRYVKRIILFHLFALFLICQGRSVYASHTMGGDIQYICLGNNRFEFTFTIYHDCLTGNMEAINADDPSFYAIFDKGTNAAVVRASTGPAIIRQVVPTGFSNECISNFPNVCMSKMVFKFTVTLPPSNNGYLFVYQRCCRNASVTNIFSPGVTGSTFTIDIPPFTAGQCINNSPVFHTAPPQIICANNPLIVDFSASDADGDSLSYELCSAYIGGDEFNPNPGLPGQPLIQAPPYNPVSYVPPFTPTAPLPANPALAINPTTGLMTGRPTAVGRYIVTVCVKEWRNGVVINTISRDQQFVVTDCSRNVIAYIPELSDQPGTYIIKCDSDRSVFFENTSSGGNTFFWDFGVPNTNSDTSVAFQPTFTYPDTGTYLVKLIVNKGTTCSDSITRLVKVYLPHHADFRFDGNLCQGSPLQFTDLSTTQMPPFTFWEWDFGDGQTSSLQNPVHTYNTNIENHVVRLISASQRGCRDTAIKTIVIPYFDPSAGNDTTIVKGYPFNMRGKGGSVYEWTPADFLQNPTDPVTATNYTSGGKYPYNLKVTSAQNCVGNDSVTITVVDKPWFIVPSGFTPNGDGRNDIVKPLSVGYVQLLYFKIYNRYGQLVFQSYSFSNGGWDGYFNGKPAETGAYYWHAAAVDPFGQTYEAKGDITLFR